MFNLNGAILRISALMLLTIPVASYADTADLQINWIIPRNSYHAEDKYRKKGSVKISSEAVPKRLFVTNSEVYSQDGVRILEEGAQLYLMTSARFMVCSQATSPQNYEGSSNRICLVDEDGDGSLDAYFARSMGRSFLSTDKMWFAMNGNIPSLRKAIQPLKISEIDKSLSKFKVKVEFNIRSISDRKISINVTIERNFKFNSICPAEQFTPSSYISNDRCAVPNFVVRGVDQQGGASELLDVLPPSRDATLRFDVDPRLLGGRLMKSAYFE